MEQVEETSFEDFSISTALEKVAFSIEQTVDKWWNELAARKELSGLCQSDAAAMGQQTAVEGAALTPADAHLTCTRLCCCRRSPVLQSSSTPCLSAPSPTS